MRADARRNQERILAAAKAQITIHGPDVGMDEIAKAAEVAVGTLYRHYPTKTHLVEAVLMSFMEWIVVRAENAATALGGPGDAMAQIEQLLTEFMDEAATNEGLKAAAQTLDAAYTTKEQEERGLAALRILVDAARSDGDLGETVSPDDIYLMMIGAPASLPKPSRDRWLQILLCGLRTA
ncbi:TetR/AcrR family transcriptional regulator [Paractinoplanes lichenicola]|uniref:TetR/AcrR family transcriptional regulator n=1 Tax=Paractinoplanes lichenicola TaxID=2802976 RepID=A0ABS1VWH6_9ACTN|nr:TetR/AcrR family transcriptional regulator [Actinoplanes lichenicola]MBL7258844.1 TetR/AcrR family transcriptional regulator [Actinoplanes lichenicola]